MIDSTLIIMGSGIILAGLSMHYKSFDWSIMGVLLILISLTTML